jgi:uncharacterized membrane protein
VSDGPPEGKPIVPADPKLINQLEKALAKAIEKVAPQELRNIGKEKRREMAQMVAVSTTISKTHIGPLPTPEDFKNYEAALPGAAERILAMAEREQHRRLEMNTEGLARSYSLSVRGQMYGFAIALVGLGAAVWMVIAGHDWAGGTVGGGTLVGLVAVFVVGKGKSK